MKNLEIIMTNFERGLNIKDKLPDDTEMVGEAMPLTTDEQEVNRPLREFLGDKPHLKEMLLESILKEQDK